MKSRKRKNTKTAYYGQLLDAAMARARDAGIELKTLLRSGHAAKTIISVAQEENFDLVLVGHSGISAVWPSSSALPRKKSAAMRLQCSDRALGRKQLLAETMQPSGISTLPWYG